MKQYKRFNVSILSLLAVLLTACSSDDSKRTLDFVMTPGSYEVQQNLSIELPIVSGNGDYTLTVGNKNIIEAVFDNTNSASFGSFKVTGLQKGETTLAVKDNIAMQTYALNIKVTDRYLCYHITESNHSALKEGRRVYLIKNDAADVYFYGAMINDSKLPLLQVGKYEFAVENNVPYLILFYPDSNGEFTEAAIAPTAHKFSLKGTDQNILSGLESFFNIDWKVLERGTRSTERPYMKMKDEGTGQTVSGYLDFEAIPVGVLK